MSISPTSLCMVGRHRVTFEWLAILLNAADAHSALVAAGCLHISEIQKSMTCSNFLYLWLVTTLREGEVILQPNQVGSTSVDRFFRYEGVVVGDHKPVQVAGALERRHRVMCQQVPLADPDGYPCNLAIIHVSGKGRKGIRASIRGGKRGTLDWKC